MGRARQHVFRYFMLFFTSGLIYCGTANAQRQAAYFRIETSPNHYIFTEFLSARLKVATSAEGLKTAKPTTLYQAQDNEIEFPEIDLPLSKHFIPAGYDKIRACFVVYAPTNTLTSISEGPSLVPPNYAYGHIAFVRRDRAGALWKYLVKVRSRTGASPGNAPVMPLPKIDNLFLKITPQIEGRDIGVIVEPASGRWELLNILRNDEGEIVTLEVFNSKGKLVSKLRTTLDNFDYRTQGDPKQWIVVSEAGEYTCTASMRGGPTKPIIRGSIKFKIE